MSRWALNFSSIPDSQWGGRRHPRPCNRLHVKAAERLQDFLRNADETEWLTHTNCSPTNPGWFKPSNWELDDVGGEFLVSSNWELDEVP